MFVAPPGSPGDTWSDEESKTSATDGDDRASLVTPSQERELIEKRPSYARHDSTRSSDHHLPLDNLSSEAEPFGVRSAQGNFTQALSAHNSRRVWKRGRPKDTHYFDTSASFQKISVPIRIPLTVFSEDVGDVGRIPKQGAAADWSLVFYNPAHSNFYATTAAYIPSSVPSPFAQ